MHGGGGVHKVVNIIMFQAHPLSALGVIGDLRFQSPSKNKSALGAFVGPDARDIDKFPLSG